MIRLVLMLMYGKKANNRKQEIDRQHHTIPNQRNLLYTLPTMPTTTESNPYLSYLFINY